MEVTRDREEAPEIRSSEMKRPSGPRLAWQVLCAEGGAGLRDRLLDRIAGWRRRRRFRLAGKVCVKAGEMSDCPVPGGLPATPVLNVLSTPLRPELGGVQLQLLRRLEAEAAHRSCALLCPGAGGYRLETRSGRRREVVVLEAPPPPVLRLNDELFAQALRDAADWVGARVVHFEQLVGLPLGSVVELRDAGFRLVLAVHDFGLFCLRPHLLERPRLRFCDYSREATRCTRCLRRDWEVEDGFQESRREVAAELLRSAEAVVYPSDFHRRTYRELYPGLDPERQWVVEPPSVGSRSTPPTREPPSHIRHIAYVGSVKAHKGALLFEELVGRLTPDRYPDLRWTVYGGGDREILTRLRRLPGVRVRGYYRAEALPRMLCDDAVDLALLLSIWPESYALTFDECLQAGVPVIALDHGAIADRVKRHGGGILVSPSAGLSAVADCLREILNGDRRPDRASGVGLELPEGRSAAQSYARIYGRLGRE
ncbi:MAG: glycosyltransferase family 4 protein [bacterium]|nr:glycosyltransferase family 4 protein [bacterium]